MPNKIEFTNIGPERFVDPLSRYSNSKVIRYGKNNKLTFTTYKRIGRAEAANDQFMVITSNFEYRPDLVSYKKYGTTDFWWQIMEVNNIFDIFEFKKGVNIRLPGNIFI